MSLDDLKPADIQVGQTWIPEPTSKALARTITVVAPHGWRAGEILIWYRTTGQGGTANWQAWLDWVRRQRPAVTCPAFRERRSVVVQEEV